MSNINQYPLTATQINDEDFYDVDYWNGVAYESRKISGLTLKTLLGGAEALNDLTDVTTNLPLTPDNADDGKQLYFDVATGQWTTDDSVTFGTVVEDCKTSTLTGSIPKGTPVYLAGYDNDLLVVEEADASDPLKMPCIGITADVLDDTNAKKLMTFGKIQGLDTSADPEGTIYYVASGGGLTTTRPTGATDLIQRIAKILKSAVSGGQLMVFNSSRTAGLPNLTTGMVWQGDLNNEPQAVAFPSGDNIYNADGTLTGQRIVDMDDNGLFFVTNDGGSQNLIMGIFDQGAAHRVEIGDTMYINDINLEVKGLSLFYNSPIINNSNSNIFLKFQDNGASFDLNFEMETLTLTDKTQTFQDKDGVIALLSDITGGDNIYTADGSILSDRYLSLNAFSLRLSDLLGTTTFTGGNSIEIIANASQEAIMTLNAGNGQKRGLEFSDQSVLRWQIITSDVESGGDTGTNMKLQRYDDLGVLIDTPFQIDRATGVIRFNDVYSFPTTDGNLGDVISTDGAGGLSWGPTEYQEKYIHQWYAYDMSPAAAYSWNGVTVGATAITTLNESYRAMEFVGTGGADGCFVGATLPLYYPSSTSVKVTVNFTSDGTGGNIHFYVGFTSPDTISGTYGDDTTTEWKFFTFVATAGLPTGQNTLVFNGTGLLATDPVSVKVFRSPADPLDTYNGIAYITNLEIEIA